MTAIRLATLAVGLAVLLALGGCGNDVATKAADKSPSSVPKTSYPTQEKQACDILTQRIAKSLLGSVGDESAAVPGPRNTAVRISSCVRASSLADLDRAGAVSLVIRVAQNSAGAQTNEDAFAPGSLPKSVQEVDGYGEKAFWNPTVGQLNILSEGNWYVLAAGPIDPTKHTLAETEKLADAIIADL